MCYKFLACESKAKEKYRGVFEIQKSGDKTSSGIYHPVFYNNLVYKLSRVKSSHNFIFSGTNSKTPSTSKVLLSDHQKDSKSCRWTKMASILVGSSVGCPLNCSLYPYLKVVGCPLSCTLSCPLYPYMEVVGSLICLAKFPLVAHGQPTPLPTDLPTFFTFESCWLSTKLPTVSIYGSSGQPNLHGKISMGSPRAAHSVAHVQPMGSEVGSSLVFSVWVMYKCMTVKYFSFISLKLSLF